MAAATEHPHDDHPHTDTAHLLLGDLIGVRRADGVRASVTAPAQAFADGGRPISMDVT